MKSVLPTHRRTATKAVAISAVVLTFTALTVVLFVLSGAKKESISEASCAPRVIGLDPSASVSAETWTLAQQTIVSAAVAAVVCGTPLTAIAAVPGQSVQIISNDDLTGYEVVGPNERVRRLRFSGDDVASIEALVDDRLRKALASLPADRSDISALLDAAADRADGSTEVIVITDGVHDDDQVSLDRPLALGDGADLAASVHVPSLAASSLTFAGVGQVTSESLPPSNVWNSEVREFVRAVCGATDAARCRVLGAATASEVLS